MEFWSLFFSYDLRSWVVKFLCLICILSQKSSPHGSYFITNNSDEFSIPPYVTATVKYRQSRRTLGHISMQCPLLPVDWKWFFCVFSPLGGLKSERQNHGKLLPVSSSWDQETFQKSRHKISCKCINNIHILLLKLICRDSRFLRLVFLLAIVKSNFTVF